MEMSPKRCLKATPKKQKSKLTDNEYVCRYINTNVQKCLEIT